MQHLCTETYDFSQSHKNHRLPGAWNRAGQSDHQATGLAAPWPSRPSHRFDCQLAVGQTACDLEKIPRSQTCNLSENFKLCLVFTRNPIFNATKCKHILLPYYTRNFWPILKIHIFTFCPIRPPHVANQTATCGQSYCLFDLIARPLPVRLPTPAGPTALMAS